MTVRMRILAVLAAGAMAVEVLAGCGTGINTPAPGDSNVAASEAPADADPLKAAAEAAKEKAALKVAEALEPAVQSALQAAGFKSVAVDSEMDEGHAVVEANVSLDQIKSGCKLQYESRATKLDIYFDEVLTPAKPDGIKVTDLAARDSKSPKVAFNYLLRKHPDCLIPGAKAPRL